MINFLIYYFAELASAGSDFLNTKDMKKDMKKVLQQLKNVSIENFVDIDNLKDRMLKLENFVGRNIPSAANDIPIKVLNTDEEILLCETKIEKLTKILT